MDVGYGAPIFEVGAGGGDGSEPISVLVYFDGQDTATENGALTVGFDASVLQASEFCTSQIGDPRPDRLVFTHNVICSIDNNVGEVQVSFAPVADGLDVSKRLFLGQILFSVADGFVPETGGTDLPLEILSVNFSGETGPGNMPGLVSIVQGWPVDVYEADDLPLRASQLTGDIYNQFDTVFGLLQARTLDSVDDKDWIFRQTGGCNPLRPTLRVSPIGPFDAANFRPIVTVFSADRLFDSTVEPLETYGDCAVSPGRVLKIDEFSWPDSTVLRVSSCESQPGSGFGYSLRLSFRFVVCDSGVVTYRGKVSEADSGIAAGVFLRSTSNQYAASNPATGEYGIIGLRNLPIDVEVLSDQYLPLTIPLPAVQGAEPGEEFDIVVTKKGEQLFANSFE